MEPGILAMREPVIQASVGSELDLHCIFLVCVSEPQTVCAAVFEIRMIFILTPIDELKIKSFFVGSHIYSAKDSCQRA